MRVDTRFATSTIEFGTTFTITSNNFSHIKPL